MPFAAIAEAQLILTDDLIRDALRGQQGAQGSPEAPRRDRRLTKNDETETE